MFVLPPASGGEIRREHRNWLSKGRLQATGSLEEMLLVTLRRIGHAVPDEGMAALRFWGQTGERSGAWMAAADPVHLEARLDHLRLHAFRGEEIAKRELRDLFSSLQEFVAVDDRFSFARLGPLAYLRSQDPIVTATCSPLTIDGLEPGEFMPDGPAAAAHDRLLGELQMVLHEHAINAKRASAGLRTINSIWIWGGGIAPQPEERPIAPLFSDDPLFRGYWKSKCGSANFWMEDIEDALQLAPEGFVAVAPDVDASPAVMADRLDGFRRTLKRGDLRSLTLLFRDGLSIDIGRRDGLRFWRRLSPLLDTPRHDD
ncbi:MAG: hypothetical protein R3192_17660 [Woeseiaceae bacterium]|nr:hypothetical protein [Woeseiaceae bacterium]